MQEEESTTAFQKVVGAQELSSITGCKVGISVLLRWTLAA